MKVVFKILELELGASRHLQCSSRWETGREVGGMVFSPIPRVSLVLETSHSKSLKTRRRKFGDPHQFIHIWKDFEGLLWDFQRNPVAICFSSSFSIPLLPLSTHCFLFSPLVLPFPECLSTSLPKSLQRLTSWASMTIGRWTFLWPGPGPWLLFLPTNYCFCGLPVSDLLSYIYNLRLEPKRFRNCWHIKLAQLVALFINNVILETLLKGI